MSDVEASAARTSDAISLERQREILKAWMAIDPAAPAAVRAFVAGCLEHAGGGTSASPPELAELDAEQLTHAARGLVTVRELASRRVEREDAPRRAAAALDQALSAVLERLAREREELVHRHRAAAETVELHERVLAVMAHDLRSPLAAIDLGGAVLLELPSTRGDPFVRKQAELIRRNVGRMSRLIADLLDSTSIHAGRLSLQRRRCPLSALVSEALEAHRALAREKEIALRSDVRLGDQVARCDRARVHQALSQLLGHSIELCDSGAEIVLQAEVCGSDARVSVAGSGAGIPEPDLPHVFELFWSGQGRRAKGPGLFIARGIIEAHGGSIGVEPNDRRGSTFWFTLPLTERSTGDREP